MRIPLFKNFLKGLYTVKHPLLEREVFGITFQNPVGLAAGFDKNATHYEAFSCFGFGFIEIGTVTAKPQPGNPKKRLFRLVEDKAIINRMGFNNEGVEAVNRRLTKKRTVIVGGNIGKNKNTPNEEAISDYLECFNALFDSVDYFVVNVSSPNTPNLRALQEKDQLRELLSKIQTCNRAKAKPKPILLKIAPDLSNDELLDIIEIVETTGISGVIATNTSTSRDGLKSLKSSEIGGLSGSPIGDLSTQVIRFLSENSKSKFPIIAVGGIMSPNDALDKLKAGASLVQLYTGLIYEGPSLVKRINKLILENCKHGR